MSEQFPHEAIQLITDTVEVDEETAMIIYMGMEFTPDQARDLADQLTAAADEAEEIAEALASEATR